MKLNTIRSAPAYYNFPHLPEDLCGQRDLANLLLHYIAFQTPAFRPPVSGKNIYRLIELAFFTSMATEEGRFPRFNIACQKDLGTPFTVTRFVPIPMDNVDVLRRVAPSCTHPECALLVAERNGRLCCDGVVNIGSMGYDTTPGRPEFHSAGSPPRLRIEINGPGHMIVHSGIMAFELRAGNFRYPSYFWYVPSVQKFREEVGQYLEQELVNCEGEEAKKLFGGSKNSVPIHVILSRMLRVAIDARHGGAFVIIPSNSFDSDPYNIDLKYPAQDLDLGQDMIAFWSACADAQRKKSIDEYRRAIRMWTFKKANMLIAAEAVGNLSCVDGCVVLNRRLQLCGFGGVIKVSEDQALKSTIDFENYKTGEKWEYKSLLEEIGGTRHQSAVRLCKAHRNMLVFIVSQDGDLKVFSSGTDKAHAFGPINVPSLIDNPPVGA